MKTLKDAKIGETVKVVKLTGEGPVKRRIMQASSKAMIFFMVCSSCLVRFVLANCLFIMVILYHTNVIM